MIESNDYRHATASATSVDRRRLLKWVTSIPWLGLGADVVAQTRADGASVPNFRPTQKLALLISNGDYPNEDDLRPARKNLIDMGGVLKSLDFSVDSHLDLDETEMRSAIAAFSAKLKKAGVQRASGESVVVFYFFGHGLQIAGTNYLVPAKVDPLAGSVPAKSQRLMEDILTMLPTGYPGLTIAFIDACRTGESADTARLNYVESPAGSLLMFGSRAGQPAFAPVEETKNSYFTHALVGSLREYNGVTSIYELCQLVEARCLEETTEQFKQNDLDIPPQQPQTYDNTQGNFVLPAAKDTPPPSAPGLADRRWAEIQQTVMPRDLKRLCEAFLLDFLENPLVPSVKARLGGAKLAIDALRKARISSSAILDQSGNNEYKEDLSKALRGDKDAAMRVAAAYETGTRGLSKNPDRQEQWLRFATELGNGIASWRLYEIYQRINLVGDAARYRSRALELGYTPPRELWIKY